MPAAITRRSALTGLAATGAVTATPGAAGAARVAGTLPPLTRIAFGSCAKQTKDQPIWDAIIEAEPDLFVFLGDNVYADSRDPAVVQAAYDALGAKPGYRRLKETTPILAIWDDHDYGENDAGAEYPIKAETRRIFCDFFDVPADDPRRSRADGLYTSHIYGPNGQTVQFLLPDLRWNRTPITELDLAGTPYDAWAAALEAAGKPVPGPYARNPDPAATMLGETQWAWLEAELARPADIRILCSSLQVLADFPGWEAWINYAHDHQRLIDAIRRQRASGLVCISGDTHYGEVSRLDVNTPYPLWDVTSSGLTEVWPVLPPNALRVGEAYRSQNFGLIEIDWAGPDTAITMKICDIEGVPRIEHVLRLRELQVAV